jgi:hypothetical protein
MHEIMVKIELCAVVLKRRCFELAFLKFDFASINFERGTTVLKEKQDYTQTENIYFCS